MASSVRELWLPLPMGHLWTSLAAPFRPLSVGLPPVSQSRSREMAVNMLPLLPVKNIQFPQQDICHSSSVSCTDSYSEPLDLLLLVPGLRRGRNVGSIVKLDWMDKLSNILWAQSIWTIIPRAIGIIRCSAGSFRKPGFFFELQPGWVSSKHLF